MVFLAKNATKNRVVYFIILLFFCCLGCRHELGGQLEEEMPEHKLLYAINGETITFAGTQSSQLIHSNVDNVDLYIISPDRKKVALISGKDYIRKGNVIYRTENSIIPDFSKHKVEYLESGQFTWRLEPNLNPELTLAYQVYADYTFNSVDRQTISGKISDRLNLHLHNKTQNLKVAYIGTSISFGVHTYERFYHDDPSQTYPYLVARAVEKIYGTKLELINKSIDGGGKSDTGY